MTITLKKILATCLIIYAVFMGFVVVGGFIKKHQSMTGSSSTSQTPSNTADISKKYTSAEVALHASKTACWLIVNNKVYDVTPFIRQHPGGAGRILEHCGMDATTAFNTQDGEGSHSSQAKQMLAGYLIGSLQ